MNRNILLFVLLFAMIALGQDQPPTGGRPAGRTVTATRTVTKYTALESTLFQALEKNDAAAIEKILADDFEAWAAEKIPPTPRADWIKMFAGNLKSSRIENMAVREFGDTFVVSFTLERSGSVNGKPMSPVLYIVDVWRKNGDRLAVRYASAPANPALSEKRPTGKE